jgi:hypothetical protein
LLIEKQHEVEQDSEDSRLGNCFELAGALGYISEPEESLERFLKLVEEYDLSQLQDGFIFISGTEDFYDSLESLPIKEGNIVLKAYLNKTDYADIHSNEDIYTMKKAFSIYADVEIAEKVFQITCQKNLTKKSSLSSLIPNPKNEIEKRLTKSYDSATDLRKAIAPYFNEKSIPLLKEQLNHKNEDIRAFCVWQLTKLGYEFASDEFENLLQDDSWKVRANTLLAVDEKEVNIANEEKNPFVKIVAKLVTETRN